MIKRVDGFKSCSRVLVDIDEGISRMRWNPLTRIKREMVREFPPEVRSFFMKFQFSILFMGLCMFYLLIFFLYPTLISAGYADACEDLDLIYLANRHTCIEEGRLMSSDDYLYNFSVFNPVVSRSRILWSTIFPLEKYRLRDEKIFELNRLRHEEDAKKLVNKDFSSFGDWSFFGLEDDNGSKESE